MFAETSPKTTDLLQRLRAFFDQHIYPNEARYYTEMDAFRRAGQCLAGVATDRGTQAAGARGGSVEHVLAA